MGHLSPVGLPGHHRGDGGRDAEQRVEVVEVVRGLLQPHAARDVEVPVRRPCVVDPAVRHVVDRLHLVHDAQPSAVDDFHDRPKERCHPHREGDHHRLLAAPVGVAKGGDLLVRDGDGLFEVQRQPDRRRLHGHRRVDVAPCPYQQRVEVPRVAEQLVGVGEEGRVPLRQLRAKKSSASAVTVRVGHRHHPDTAVDSTKNPEQRSGPTTQPDNAEIQLPLHRDASVAPTPTRPSPCPPAASAFMYASTRSRVRIRAERGLVLPPHDGKGAQHVVHHLLSGPVMLR